MSKIISYKKITGDFIVLSVFLLVFFYDSLNKYLGFYDEFLALLSLVTILYISLFKKKIKIYKQEIYILFFLLLILIIGLSSNYHSYKSGYSTAKQAIIGDLISFFKAFVVYFGIRLLSEKINSKKIVDNLIKYSEVIFYLLVLILIIDTLFHIFPQYHRFGLTSYQLFFTHTSRFGFAFAFLFLLLFPRYFNKKNLFLIFVLSLGVLSLRVKYFGFFILSTLFIYYGKVLFRIPKKTFLIVFGIILFIVGLIFKDQFEMYFNPNKLEMGWSRAVILYYSFKIGNDFSPLGTGFGTYASFFSGKYYSWVYELYGIDNVYGISKQYWEFVSDQFWPMLLGQFGYFGLISFAGIIYNYFMLFLKQIKEYSIMNNYRFVPFLGLILLLIDSSSDAIFTQNRAVVMFLVFGLFVNIQKKINVQNQ